MASLTGKVAWVTGAGSGIGQAAAIALAKEGATVVLTGRRKEPLEETAATIKKAGGKAVVKPGDLMKAAAVDQHRQGHRQEVRPLRHPGEQRRPQHPRPQVEPSSRRPAPSMVIDGNLSSAFYCSTAVLPMMRKRKDGVLIHTSSMAGRNRQPAERAGLFGGQARRGGDEPHHQHGGMRQRHPLLRRLPGRGGDAHPRQAADPITKEERARMAQSEDVGDLIRYVACLPPHIVINEVMINPTWNRGYVADLQRAADEKKAKAEEVGLDASLQARS